MGGTTLHAGMVAQWFEDMLLWSSMGVDLV